MFHLLVSLLSPPPSVAVHSFLCSLFLQPLSLWRCVCGARPWPAPCRRDHSSAVASRCSVLVAVVALRVSLVPRLEVPCWDVVSSHGPSFPSFHHGPSLQHRKVTGARSACAIFGASITGHFCAVLLYSFFIMHNGRYRNWVFTLNNPYYALTPEIDFVGSPVSFMAWQLEIGGASSTEHYQGYIELDRPCSLLQMHQLGNGMLLGAHFEVIYFAPFFPSLLSMCSFTLVPLRLRSLDTSV